VKQAVLEGDVVAFARGGDGIVEAAGARIFAPGAVPGDRVRIRTTERIRGALHATSFDLVTPSPDRVAPPCVYASVCGGCPFMSASMALQRETKRGFVSSALGREVSLVSAGGEVGYRRRARLAFDARGRRIGYRGRRSNAVIDVARCLVLSPPLEAALDALRARVSPSLTGRGEIRVAVSSSGRPVVRIDAEAPQTPALYAELESLVSEGAFQGASVLAGGATKPAVIGDPRERTLGYDGGELVGTDGGFSQANDEVNALLVAQTVAYARTAGASVLELYAGHGNLTAALAPGAARYVAVELDTDAAGALRENAKSRGLDVRVLARDASDAPKGGVDVVVLDPPRTGAAEAIAGIVAACPTRIVYVSCAPETLARDVRVLAKAGFALRDAVAFDMFPHTPHVETVALLERT